MWDFYKDVSNEDLIIRVQKINTSRIFINQDEIMSLVVQGFTRRSYILKTHLLELISWNMDVFFRNCYSSVILDCFKFYSIEFDLGLFGDLISDRKDLFYLMCSSMGVKVLNYLPAMIASPNALIRCITLRNLTFLLDSNSIDLDYLTPLVDCVVLAAINFEDIEFKSEVARFGNYATDERVRRILKFYLEEDTDYVLRLLSSLGLSRVENKLYEIPDSKSEKLKHLLGIQ